MTDMLAQADQRQLPEEKVNEWMEEDLGLPGYHHQAEAEIAQNVQHTETPIQKEEGEEEEVLQHAVGPPLAAGDEACDTFLKLIDRVRNLVANHYETIFHPSYWRNYSLTPYQVLILYPTRSLRI